MEKFIQDTQSLLGFHLTKKQVASFKVYEEELFAWNEKFNLTAIREVEGVRTKHFLDSLTCLAAIGSAPPGRLADIGTGAGFPGIPLKIIFPSMRLTLVDSVGKKVDFCRHIAARLNMDGVETLQSRAEDIGQLPAHREKYDWVVARAVASLPILVEYLLPLVRVGGTIIAQKGESGPVEAQAAERACHLLGGRLKIIQNICLPGVVEERYLIVIEKVAATPPQYPRRVGLAVKKPLH